MTPRTSALAVLILLACTAAAGAQTGDSRPGHRSPLVLILAGQSNMVGLGVTGELSPEESALPGNVTYLVGRDETCPADLEKFGPEITLGRMIGEALPDREIVLVKHAVGATSLLAWAPRWDPARAATTRNAAAGPLYAQLLEFLHELDPAGEAEVGAVFWMQGEKDAVAPETGAEYLSNLGELIHAFRRDLSKPDLPFILGLVNPPPDRFPARQAVRDAQKRAAREIPEVFLVPTDDLTKWDDRIHYDTRGALELGRRFAATYLEATE